MWPSFANRAMWENPAAWKPGIPLYDPVYYQPWQRRPMIDLVEEHHCQSDYCEGPDDAFQWQFDPDEMRCKTMEIMFHLTEADYGIEFYGARVPDRVLARRRLPALS